MAAATAAAVMTNLALRNTQEATTEQQDSIVKTLAIEFICTFLFVFVAVGSAIAAGLVSGDPLVGLFFVGTSHAFAVAVMISAGFTVSAGHLNPAVTLGLAMGGHISYFRSVLYCIIQCVASPTACLLLKYLTGGQETPVHTLAVGMTSLQGVIMEVVLTFSLLFTIYATIMDPKKVILEGLGPLLTGLVVGANIFAGGIFSGASMNPALSFGPALVSGVWTNHWVYWVGPLVGGALAGFVYDRFFVCPSYAVVLPREEDARSVLAATLT